MGCEELMSAKTRLERRERVGVGAEIEAAMSEKRVGRMRVGRMKVGRMSLSQDPAQ